VDEGGSKRSARGNRSPDRARKEVARVIPRSRSTHGGSVDGLTRPFLESTCESTRSRNGGGNREKHGDETTSRKTRGGKLKHGGNETKSAVLCDGGGCRRGERLGRAGHFHKTTGSPSSRRVEKNEVVLKVNSFRWRGRSGPQNRLQAGGTGSREEGGWGVPSCATWQNSKKGRKPAGSK